MTKLQIVVDGKVAREWNFTKYDDAITAEIESAKFIQKHIEKDYSMTTPFVWKKEEPEQ